MKVTRNEIVVDRSWQKALLNHFIKELFGDEALRADVEKFPPDEYRRVIDEFMIGNCSSMSDSMGNVPSDLGRDREILLSFFKHYALHTMSSNEVVPIKDHLANHLGISAMLRVFSPEEFEMFFRDKG